MPSIEINGNIYSPELILFDVDGTLVDDSHRYSSLGKARYTTFKENVSGRAAKQWARLAGVNPEDWTIDSTGPISKAPRRDDLAIAGAALYLEGFNWYDAREKAETLYEIADKIQAETFEPALYVGVKEKLEELYEAGFKLGIATNGVTTITEEMLAGLGIRDMFSVVIGADKVEKSKPAPDMILLASKTVGTPIGYVVYVGDQPTDIRAAEAAETLAGVAVRNIIEDATESTSSVADFKIIKES
ncbi:HAD family hydrolase [Candidatus Bathyarchaeota archaeon]|jgi:phosphoglycolate phosphatase|nr:MAG: HAD family hydrolase [Candidatus Bathyarchaeota archaeon]